MRTFEELRELTDRPLRATPFYGNHREQGATLFLSGEWVRALEYDGLGATAEHRACRSHAGLFDVSSIGKLAICGPGARSMLNRAMTRDIRALRPGRGAYTCACDERGRILADPIVYCCSESHFYVTVSGAQSGELADWLRRLASREVTIEDRTVSLAYLAVQGPAARQVLASICGGLDLSSAALPYFSCAEARIASVPTLLCRTGYTGEAGYELNFSAEYGAHMWSELLAAGESSGLVPCGAMALQTLRLEKAYPGYGWDLSVDNDPFEAGLGWTVEFDSGDFIGRKALLTASERLPRRRLLPIRFEARTTMVQAGDAIELDGRTVGRVTSALFGPTVNAWIGLALVDSSVRPGEMVSSIGPDRTAVGTIANGAFYDPEGNRLRA